MEWSRLNPSRASQCWLWSSRWRQAQPKVGVTHVVGGIVEQAIQLIALGTRLICLILQISDVLISLRFDL